MIPNFGIVKLRKLLDRFENLERIFKVSANELTQVAGIGEKLALHIKKIINSKDFYNELKQINKQHINVVTLYDDEYPLNLKAIYDPPIVLYIKGTLIKDDAISIAIVGSRKSSNYGLKMTEDISRGLADKGICIISGMARGIDSAAHKGALLSEGRTIAVLGSGLNYIYPPENKELFNQISDHGAVISEFPLGRKPARRNFPIRNRVISGLSLGVVVIEARRRSGSLITADCALEQGREVYAVPHAVGFANSEGTHKLIQQGAKLIEGADSIIEELPPYIRNYIELNDRGDRLVPLEIIETEKRIYELFDQAPCDVRSLSLKLELSPEDVQRSLLSLQIKGLIQRISDKAYIKSEMGEVIG
jgi:DNA processing protein